MIRTLVALLAFPVAASAGFECTLQNTACLTDCAITSVQFDIDPAQFVAPQDPNDPPRRQITMVQMDDARFVADAIMMGGGVFGFHEDAGALGSRLLIVQPDGTARLSLQPSNIVMAGSCITSPD